MNAIPLTRVDCEQLEDIFRQEIQCWQEELFWDYRPAVSLIRKYVSSHTLPGWAIKTDQGEVSGYSYYVVNHPVGYIGNLYLRSEYATPNMYSHLLDKIIHSLDSTAKIRRIESQLFAFNCELASLFESRGFAAVERHFLFLSLNQPENEQRTTHDLENFPISKWEERFFNPTADVIYNSYRGSPDRLLCYDYQSREGCFRFLHNLIHHPSCGIFAPETSLIALDSQGELCGVLLTSTIGPGTGMIPQISVRNDCQGMGIGSGLLKRYFREARQYGLEKITLSVSDANHRAHQLYLRLGFQKRKGFHAFVQAPNQDIRQPAPVASAQNEAAEETL
jgi:ribosomal protein S18 acetylase RimI-like enzyme